MKLLIVTALFVAAVSSSPMSHTLAVGSNGVVGTSTGSILSPLVELVINIGKGLGNLVSVEGLPETQKPVDPVIVVDHPALPSPVQPVPETPGVAQPELPGGAVVVDPIVPETPIVAPELPEGVQVAEPILPELPVQVVDPVLPESPIVAPELPEGVQVAEPIVPEVPVQVVDPVVPETPILVPGLPDSGVQVVNPIVPETPIVAPGLPDSGVQVVDGVNPAPAAAIEPESENANQVTNNFLINVLLNFFTGQDGTPSFSSGLPDFSSLPPGLQQLLTPRAALTAA